MKNKTTLFLIVFFILLTAAFMTYYFKTTRDQPKVLSVLGNPGHTVADFSFTNQDGKTITRQDVKGKLNVVEYFFTTCKGICPKMNENMRNVYAAYRGNKDVLILSHTVDPVKDTVATMKAYSLKFDADPAQWMFLTGDKKQLYDMARNSYLVTAADDTASIDIKSDFIHTNRFVLVDRAGRIRGSYDGTSKTDINLLIGDIQSLLRTNE
jgi:protein SCO1